MPASEPTNKPTPTAKPASAALVFLFLGFALADLANLFGKFWPESSWLHGALVIAGFAASIAALSPPLAAVNVIMAGALAGGVGGIAIAVSAVTGYPLGPVDFTPAAGLKIAGLLPWWLPLVWASIALSSRGAARFLLHGQRHNPQHGYRVIAVASGLAIIATIAFNLFAMHGDRYWKHAQGSSLFISSGHVLHLLIQVAITALMIDKFPGKQTRNKLPLVVWVATGTTTALAATG